MSILGDITGGIADVANFGMDLWKTNYDVQQQNIQRQREDTAVQRRVADLKAAGLSPTLAAGSAASSSSPIDVGTPQIKSGNLMNAVSMQTAQKQNALTDANLDLVRAQIDKTDADSYINRMFRDVMSKDASNNGVTSFDLVQSMAERMAAENKSAVRSSEEAIRNTDIAREAGVASNSSNALDVINMGRLMSHTTGNLRDIVSKWGSLILKYIH